eukprot:TRINITY_DN5387_c0_g1_i1.p1 TRINITY_DN5387_c0_g1~~TRINITY_DN5387_c0_g1_i1.p1  ORF type:complete len:1278 (-),score=397.49 TRINITY_DN5387_c0_g1_i1:42-3875(-)
MMQNIWKLVCFFLLILSIHAKDCTKCKQAFGVEILGSIPHRNFEGEDVESNIGTYDIFVPTDCNEDGECTPGFKLEEISCPDGLDDQECYDGVFDEDDIRNYMQSIVVIAGVFVGFIPLLYLALYYFACLHCCCHKQARWLFCMCKCNCRSNAKVNPNAALKVPKRRRIRTWCCSCCMFMLVALFGLSVAMGYLEGATKIVDGVETSIDAADYSMNIIKDSIIPESKKFIVNVVSDSIVPQTQKMYDMVMAVMDPTVLDANIQTLKDNLLPPNVPGPVSVEILAAANAKLDSLPTNDQFVASMDNLESGLTINTDLTNLMSLLDEFNTKSAIVNTEIDEFQVAKTSYDSLTNSLGPKATAGKALHDFEAGATTVASNLIDSSEVSDFSTKRALIEDGVQDVSTCGADPSAASTCKTKRDDILAAYAVVNAKVTACRTDGVAAKAAVDVFAQTISKTEILAIKTALEDVITAFTNLPTENAFSTQISGINTKLDAFLLGIDDTITMITNTGTVLADPLDFDGLTAEIAKVESIIDNAVPAARSLLETLKNIEEGPGGDATKALATLGADFHTLTDPLDGYLDDIEAVDVTSLKHEIPVLEAEFNNFPDISAYTTECTEMKTAVTTMRSNVDFTAFSSSMSSVNADPSTDPEYSQFMTAVQTLIDAIDAMDTTKFNNVKDIFTEIKTTLDNLETYDAEFTAAWTTWEGINFAGGCVGDSNESCSHDAHCIVSLTPCNVPGDELEVLDNEIGNFRAAQSDMIASSADNTYVQSTMEGIYTGMSNVDTNAIESVLTTAESALTPVTSKITDMKTELQKVNDATSNSLNINTMKSDYADLMTTLSDTGTSSLETELSSMLSGYDALPAEDTYDTILEITNKAVLLFDEIPTQLERLSRDNLEDVMDKFFSSGIVHIADALDELIKHVDSTSLTGEITDNDIVQRLNVLEDVNSDVADYGGIYYFTSAVMPDDVVDSPSAGDFYDGEYNYGVISDWPEDKKCYSKDCLKNKIRGELDDQPISVENGFLALQLPFLLTILPGLYGMCCCKPCCMRFSGILMILFLPVFLIISGAFMALLVSFSDACQGSDGLILDLIDSKYTEPLNQELMDQEFALNLHDLANSIFNEGCVDTIFDDTWDTTITTAMKIPIDEVDKVINDELKDPTRDVLVKASVEDLIRNTSTMITTDVETFLRTISTSLSCDFFSENYYVVRDVVCESVFPAVSSILFSFILTTLAMCFCGVCTNLWGATYFYRPPANTPRFKKVPEKTIGGTAFVVEVSAM